MTVPKTPVAVVGITPLARAAIRAKSISDTRPVTATLECPAVLDITLLKKLDMTSFTKKGLIAISKICGISLVKRSDDKKIRKRLKRQAVERVKKEARKKSISSEISEEPNPGNVSRRKGPTLKSVPKIKVSDASVSRTRTDTPKDASFIKSISPRLTVRDGKPSVEDILYGHVEIVVAEPCKTCGRSEQPERFHSHPKNGSGRKQHGQKKVISPLGDSDTSAVSEVKSITSKLIVSPKTTIRRHSTGHLQSETTRRLSVADLEPSFHSDHEIEVLKMSLPTSGEQCGSSSLGKKKTKAAVKPRSKVYEESIPTKRTPKSVKPQEASSPIGSFQKAATSSVERPSPDSSEDLKYVTGCYVCGEQMSSELRFAHEEQCIAEWRKQNSHLPADQRKAEPLRPDFRFTATGSVDFEGTFKSIWANHMDSLVPCGKCKRTFFPERIEKHEACCTGQLKRQKIPTLRNK